MLPNQRGVLSRDRASTTPAAESTVVALLGEVALRRDGALTPLPGARSRLLLTALALSPGRSRSAAALIDDVWGEQPPRAPMNALHTQVSRLRGALPDGALEIGPAGYRLVLPYEQVDLTLAGELRQAARRRRDSGDMAECLELVARARALWRGEPGADLPAGVLATELGTVSAALLTELDTLELEVREAGGDLDGALTIARTRAAAEPLDEPAQATFMRLLARTGRANEALESFAIFRTRLAEQLGADPGRALVELNTAILRGDPLGAAPPAGAVRIAAPPPESAGPAPIGLRAAPNALLGRDADLTELEQLLRTSRVTTVLGPGGGGKTRIANEVGARAARTGSVVLVELASVRAETDAEARVEIEAAISAALGLSDLPFDTQLRVTRTTPDMRKRLRDAFGARPQLLILDNCEHLVDAVAVVVADLIGVCARLTVLTTSRSPLMITAETVYPLPPLAIDAAGSPATDLFIARAKAVRPSVRLDPQEVAHLCHTLDGLPLAIELAAARVRTMSVGEINTRLQDRFALLRNADRSSPERHRTLHAVIDWSWNLLDPAQQLALRRLCRLPAGFTMDAAVAVAGGPDLADVPAAVDGLVNQSLLTVLADDRTGTRYRMLETVREYGEEHLAAADGEAAVVMDRMLDWAVAFADDVGRRWADADQAALVFQVGAEVDNLLAALRYAVERRDANAVYLIFPVVGALWLLRGAHLEVVNWSHRVIELAPGSTGSRAPSGDLLMGTYTLLFLHLAHLATDRRVLARVRLRVRELLRTRTDLSEKSVFVARVMLIPYPLTGLFRLLTRGTRAPDIASRTIALILRANVRENLGDVRGSMVDAERALRIIPPGDLWTISMVARHLGGVSSQTARYAEATGYYRRAIELLRQLGAQEEALEIRSFLVASLVGMGALAEARREADAALSAVEPAGAADQAPGAAVNPLLATVYISVAELTLAEGDIDAGLGRYRRALDHLGWPEHGIGPGPGGILMASGALGAQVLQHRADPADPLVDELISVTLRVLVQFQDLPQIGSAACAVGSHCVASGRDVERGLLLLALAPNVAARQDYPSMRLTVQLAAARAAVGDERVDAALARVARLRRRDSARRIMELLNEIRG